MAQQNLIEKIKKTEDFSNVIDFECLPKNPEYVYLLLFEQEPYDGNKSDEFITEAAKLAGYNGQYWHTEIVYFDQKKYEWMAIGCRPPTCSSDFPVYRLQYQFRGYTAAVRQLRVPLEKQAQARKWFENALQGQPYDLAGPHSTNCTDAVVGLGQKAGVLQDIRRVTRDEFSRLPGIRAFLFKWDLPSVDSVMKRESIIFPDELENIGRYIGTMQF
ncbi:hypothetical protein HZC21_04965 [Candidatus Peregrinibacteria bacterium]|nr:hypothetical protein [Candidatus Peregrinibacteria bacterium]